MKQGKRKALEEKGYFVGSAKEFFGLTKEESEFVELKLALARGLVRTRRRKKMTQVELAKLVKSSQSRVAKMEAGDPTVSMDLKERRENIRSFALFDGIITNFNLSFDRL